MMVETLSEYAWAILSGAVVMQVLLCAVPAIVYMTKSERGNVFVLGGIVAGLHLAIVGAVAAISALSRNADMQMTWLAVSMLDLPVTYAFPSFESALSMPLFFTLLGTAQYFVSGLIIGVVWRYAKGESLLILLVPLLLAGAQAHAAGPCTHIEMGQRAWDKYLVPGEALAPGFAELRTDDDAMRAFYSGCTFPDIMQGGINGDAAEAAHWYPFEKAYFDLIQENYPPPWTKEARKNVAFYLGVLCHNVGDWAWHFDYKEHKCVLTMAEAEGLHSLDRVGDIFSHMAYTIRPDMTGKFWWPEKDALNAFRRAGIACTAEDIQRGSPSQDAGWRLGRRFAAIAYPVFSARWPWTRKHMDDYYYGGVEHCAALCAMCIRQQFAWLNGAYVYQNIPVESAGFPKGQPFLPMTDNVGDKPYLEFNTRPGLTVTVTINGIARPKSGEVEEAMLWLHFAGRGEENQVDSIEISVVAQGTGPVARASILPTDQPDKWVAWDVTPLAQESVEKGKPCVVTLESEYLAGQPALRFDSCAALRTEQGEYGGTRVAWRPILVVK
jgi:hypothetical protein